MACVSTFQRVLMAFVAPWTSRKLWMVVFSLFVINSMFWTAVWYLYTFTDPAHIKAFEAMFQTAMWTNSAVVLGYLGFQSMISGFTHSTASTTQSVLQEVFTKKEETITTRTEGGAKAFDEVT